MHFYFKKRTRKRAIKRSEHVCAFAWLQSSNSGQLQIAGGGEWPDSSLRETGPPYRISITSDDLFFTSLPLACLRGTAPPPLHVLLSYLSFVLKSSPLICLLSLPLPLPHTPPPLLREVHCAIPCSQTLSQLDPTTWTTSILSSFTSLPQNN